MTADPPDHATPAAIELHAGELRLALRPDLGGAIAGLWLGDLPVLRSTEPAALERVRGAACYPLAPYSNRLGFRRFRWAGREHTTAANFEPGEPHSLHGVAWQRAWQVTEAGAHSVEMRYRHEADDHWPFDFELRQRVGLGPSTLELQLAFTNGAAESQPVGLGWHPYFPKRARSRLHIECSERWESDPTTRLPTRRVAQPGIDAEVRHLDFDHCFDGWHGAARIRDEKLSLRLSASTPHLVVFTPQDKDHYCVEPVSHVSNAIHMSDPLAHGLVALAPGRTLEAWMKLEIARA